jgi:hypothetical protein
MAGARIEPSIGPTRVNAGREVVQAQPGLRYCARHQAVLDQPGSFEGEDHLVDGWRTDTEMSLQVSFSRRPAEDAPICVDEGQILTLLRRETWGRRRRHRYIVYAGVICGKHLVRVNAC